MISSPVKVPDAARSARPADQGARPMTTLAMGWLPTRAGGAIV
jgi:hypothetical protein